MACTGGEDEDPQEGCARFEVQVSLRNALTALRDISSDNGHHKLHQHPCKCVVVSLPATFILKVI